MGKCVDASPVLACRAAAPDAGEEEEHGRAAVTAYVGSHAGLVKAVDLHSGALLWAAPLPDRLEASCVLSPCGGLVLVGCHDEHLYALCARSGAVRWRHRAAGQVKAPVCCLPPNVGAPRGGGGGGGGGVALCACYGGRLSALRVGDGAERWRGALDGPAFAAPVADPARARVYAADLRGALHAFAVEPAGGGSERDAGAPAEEAEARRVATRQALWTFRTTPRGGAQPGGARAPPPRAPP